ncbi:SphA family protein [Bradyrhizobium sp. McL0615]|uniref:SphA family protein n=1 Tax=Bradyrhizobium sp. McL0615 TaxID=3415673 RepID=UPI003CF2F3A7
MKWNQGVHNEMVYFTGNIPSGTYDQDRLANLSLGFAAFDIGDGYTCFDPKAGHEFSVVAGLTYSLPNSFLQYQNGIDFHIDWAASKFVTKTVQIGVVGYFLQQITDDSGPGAVLGGFRGRTVGIGPQIGFVFPKPFEGYQGYLNLKAYKDLETENRPNGWSSWLTFAVSAAPPEPAGKRGWHK